jgi:hypothetical protein
MTGGWQQKFALVGGEATGLVFSVILGRITFALCYSAFVKRYVVLKSCASVFEMNQNTFSRNNA